MSKLFANLDEAHDAERSFSLWQSKQHDQADEYTLKKRKAELYALVRKVIKNELDQQQQEIVRLHWYEEKSFNEISEILGIDRSTVARKDKKINDIIFDKLKYALEYRFGEDFSENSMQMINSNRFACCPIDGENISQRLRNLRMRQCLSQEDLKKLTGITVKRQEEIESNGTLITIQELGKMTRVFKVSTDYIIFGKNAN